MKEILAESINGNTVIMYPEYIREVVGRNEPTGKRVLTRSTIQAMTDTVFIEATAEDRTTYFHYNARLLEDKYNLEVAYILYVLTGGIHPMEGDLESVLREGITDTVVDVIGKATLKRVDYKEYLLQTENVSNYPHDEDLEESYDRLVDELKLSDNEDDPEPLDSRIKHLVDEFITLADLYTRTDVGPSSSRTPASVDVTFRLQGAIRGTFSLCLMSDEDSEESYTRHRKVEVNNDEGIVKH